MALKYGDRASTLNNVIKISTSYEHTNIYMLYDSLHVDAFDSSSDYSPSLRPCGQNDCHWEWSSVPYHWTTKLHTVQPDDCMLGAQSFLIVTNNFLFHKKALHFIILQMYKINDNEFSSIPSLFHSASTSGAFS